MSAKTTTLGEHIATQKGYAFKSGWFCDSGRPVVKVKDFTANSVDPHGVTHVSEEIAAQYLKYQLRTGDVVIQTVGSWPSAPASVVGKCVRVPRTVDRALLNQNAVKISPSSCLDGGFLYYSLKNPAFGEYIVGTAQGAASQAAITLEAIRAYKINLPDLSTQRKIAGILSAYDDLIENNLRRIKILEEMAQSLYREWFVHFRFPGHESTKFVDSELGLIPKGWEIVTVNDMCDRVTDGSHSSPPSVEEGMPMLSSKDMHTFGLNLETSRTISHSDYEKLVRNGCKPRANDILITKDGANYLKYIFVVEKDLDVVLLSSIAILTPNAKINSHLFAAVLNSLENKERLKNFVTGAAIPRIILKDFKQFQFVLPPSELQAEWAKVGEFSTKLCWDLSAKNKNLRRTRDLLLPKLLSPRSEPSY